MRELPLRAFVFLIVAIGFGCGSPETGERSDVPPEDEPILLTVGEQRTITFPGMIHAAVGDPSVVDLEELLASEQVRLTAVGQGATTMLVWNVDGSDRLAYLIQVTAADAREGAEGS